MRSEGLLKALGPWSEREDLSDAFLRLLEAAPDGGREIAECLSAAQRIDPKDEESWYRAWTQCAAAISADARLAVSGGSHETAMRKWSRAVDCYEAAACPLSGSHEQQQAVRARMRDCARGFLDCCEPQGEVVTIPWRQDYPLEAYFLPARSGADSAPTVLCIVEPGRRKETALFRLAAHASQRGLSLLVVDLLGAGPDCRFEEIVGRRDLESAVAGVTDYAISRDDVDEERIAILAHDWSSSFVARGIAFDPRYAAAVCDAGLWDIHERVFLSRRLAPSERCNLSIASEGLAARHITCPLLVTVPERGWLRADIATRLIAQIKRDRADITLKVFPDGGADRLEPNAFIFDWIAARLGGANGLRS